MLWVGCSELASLLPDIHFLQRQLFITKIKGGQRFWPHGQVFRFDKTYQEIHEHLELSVMQCMDKNL